MPDDLRLNGCFSNKHASGLRKVYLGLDRVVWTGVPGGQLYRTCVRGEILKYKPR